LVEEMLKSYPGLEDAAVFSVTNELGVEEIWSLIVVRSQLDERKLRAHCESKLPPNFIPVRLITIDALPKNAMGKLERRELPSIARSKLN
jgi:acyl-coenzyme A synthetase/AMP-(fatty) acid ligase